MSDTFGIGRSVEPASALPQQAWRVDNTMELRPDELLVDVKVVSVNLVSFNEIREEAGENDRLLCHRVLEIIQDRGKLHNPVTNTGGMFYGTVARMGPEYPNHYNLSVGDGVVSLTSLTITPFGWTASWLWTTTAPSSRWRGRPFCLPPLRW